MTRDNSNKLRAVFLAALMFLWLFAGTVAFAGSAAADQTLNVADGDYENEEFFQGEEITLTELDEIGVTDDDSVQLRQVTNRDSDNNPTNFQTRATRSVSDGEAVFTTDNLPEGEYVLRETDTNQLLNATTDDFSASAGDSNIAEASVGIQTMSVDFEDEEVRAGDEVELQFDSPERGGDFNVTVSEDSLDAEELNDTFIAGESNITEFIGSSELNEDDDELLLVDVDNFFEQDVTIPSDLDEGDYEFNFEVEDTTAQDSASLTVLPELEGEVNFAEGQFTQERGDVAEITFETEGLSEGDEFELTIGDNEDTGYEVNMTVEINEDEEATVRMNTFLAGNLSGNSENATFVSEDSDVVDDTVTLVEELDNVIDVGDYDLVVEVNDEETDVATLDIVERSTDEHNIWTVPHSEIQSPDDGDIELDDITELAENGQLTQSDTIAIADDDRSGDRRGDVIVHEISASGIFGAAEAEGAANAQTLIDNGINVSYEQLNPRSNRAPAELVNPDALKLVADDENNTLYAIADSDELDIEQGTNSVGPRTGDEFEAQVELSTDYLDNFTRDDLEEGDEEVVTADFEFVDRELTFDTDEDMVTVPASADADITGTTTVAPGTELRVRTRASGEGAFLRTADADIDENGEFAAEFDFSDRDSGQEFTASVRQQSFDDNAETDGVVGDVEEPEGANFAVSDLEPADAEVEQGTAIDVSATITNEGDENGTQTVMLTVDGDELDSEEVELDAGDNTTVEFTDIDTSDLDAGDYTHAIETENDSESGTLTITVEDDGVEDDGVEDDGVEDDGVEDDGVEDDTDTETPDDTEDQAGFGAVVALVALLGAALLATRRNAQN